MSFTIDQQLAWLRFLLLKFSPDNKKATLSGGFRFFKSPSGLRSSRFLFRFGCGSLALQITLTTFFLNGFVVLLAHSSLHSFGNPIWCETL